MVPSCIATDAILQSCYAPYHAPCPDCSVSHSSFSSLLCHQAQHLGSESGPEHFKRGSVHRNDGACARWLAFISPSVCSLSVRPFSASSVSGVRVGDALQVLPVRREETIPQRFQPPPHLDSCHPSIRGPNEPGKGGRIADGGRRHKLGDHMAQFVCLDRPEHRGKAARWSQWPNTR